MNLLPQNGWLVFANSWNPNGSIKTGKKRILPSRSPLNIVQLSATYRLTLSMAFGSGGGMAKQTPGKVLVAPSEEITFQLLLSEKDFRVNFSSLEIEPYTAKTMETHCKSQLMNCKDVFNPLFRNYWGIWRRSGLHLVSLPVAQGHHRDGFVGGSAAQLQRRNGCTPSPQVGQLLLRSVDSIFLHLERNKAIIMEECPNPILICVFWGRPVMGQ